MTKFVPSGYLSIRDALDRLGRELFPSAWTGEEHKARRGLISEEEWLKNKDLPPARGAGACGSGRSRKAPAAKATPDSSDDPSNPMYQEEYRAGKRQMEAHHRLRETRGRSARGGHIGSLERETAPSLGFIVASVRCRSDDRKGGSTNTGQAQHRLTFGQAIRRGQRAEKADVTGKNPGGDRGLKGKNCDGKPDAASTGRFPAQDFSELPCD